MIPFLSGDISYEQIIELYPILAPLKFERIPDCDKIVLIVKRKLDESCKLIDNPVVSVPAEDHHIESDNERTSDEHTNTSDEITAKVDEKRLLMIYEDLKYSKIREVSKMALTEITNYSEKEDFWNFKVSRQIIRLLIFSADDNYRVRGIYVLTQMLKKSRQILGEINWVIRNANELFAHKLLESIKPDSLKRISSDSLDILEIILDYDNLFNFCTWSLIDGIKNIKNDIEYSDYGQRFVIRLELGNRGQILTLCEKMRMLAKTSQDKFVRRRALDLFNAFYKKADSNRSHRSAGS